MLPTKDSTGLWIDKVKTKEGYSYVPKLGELQNKGLCCSYQHHYFTSDEEITPFEKCWVFDSDSNKVFFNGREENTKGLTHTKFFHKIVATTDKSLFTNKIWFEGHRQRQRETPIFIPWIPQQFLEDFCKAGGIWEAELEMKGEPCTCIVHEESEGCFHCDYTGIGHYELKLTPNNGVIVHLIKEKMYNREEVEKLCTLAMSQGVINSMPAQSTMCDHMTIDNWIKENL